MTVLVVTRVVTGTVMVIWVLVSDVDVVGTLAGLGVGVIVTQTAPRPARPPEHDTYGVGVWVVVVVQAPRPRRPGPQDTVLSLPPPIGSDALTPADTPSVADTPTVRDTGGKEAVRSVEMPRFGVVAGGL